MAVDPGQLDTKRMRPRPIPCTAVGIALSGGGIRSAAFCLGALQALDFHHVIPHADYLSTVSGGGYTGACVTAGMSESNGKFPFGTSDIRDNDAIGHLRNYSNYLLPRAHSQVRNALEVSAVFLRGLIGNGLLVFVFLLAATLITKAAYPTWGDLPSGNFLPKLVSVVLHIPKYLASLLPGPISAFVNYAYAWISDRLADGLSLVGLSDTFEKISKYLGSAVEPFLTTLLLTAITAITLVIWALARSASNSAGNDVNSGFLVIARGLIAITLASFLLDLQPIIIHAVVNYYESTQFNFIFTPSVLAAAASLATIVSLLAQRLGSFLETTQLATSWRVQSLRILTRIAIIAAGLVLPVMLFGAYWYLTACLYDEVKVPQFVTAEQAVRLDAIMLVVFGAIVFSFEANAYSLHQFYKDRLSKAFLFKPTDTMPQEPQTLLNFKLSNIIANNSPYHIFNAA